jgi:hypothetical protein
MKFVFAGVLALAWFASPAIAQQADAGSVPDAPRPQVEVAMAAEAPAATSQNTQNPPSQVSAAGNAQSTQQSTQQATAQATQQSGSSSSQAGQPSEETEHQRAEEQLQEQEHQRVAGIMATFNTTRNRDAAPLSPGQKFHLFFKSAFDPWPFGLNVVVAGVNQAANSDPEWGQGMQGYAKRYGAAYSDYFIGNFFGNAVLPSLLREDPRYFQKGSGSFTNRFLWAAASTVWCKRDGGGWGPNYANVGGNLIGAAIGRLYYPASERTVSDTISDGLTVSAEGIVGAEVIEFWPDMVRHHQRKLAEKQAREIDAAEKQNAKSEQNQN